MAPSFASMDGLRAARAAGPPIRLWPLEIPVDFLKSVELAASRPSYIQAHKGAHNCSQRRNADAVCSDDLSLTGRVCHAEYFFFNDTATTEIYTLSLHDALPI